MKKRLMSMVLVFAMIFTMLGSAAPAFAANGGTSLKIEADKAQYYPGETITYTLTMGPATNVGGIRIQFDIPEGLTYVPNSGKAVEGLREKLNAVKADFVEKSKTFIFLGETAYSNTEDTALVTFQCTADTLGQKTLGYVESMLQCISVGNDDLPCTVSTSTVNVVERPLEHNITVHKGEHGTASADYRAALAGTPITLTVQADTGYHFDYWDIMGPEGLVISEDNTFEMPDANVDVKPVFAPDLYTVTVNGEEHKNVPHDSKLGAVLPEENPTLEGHTFAGWYCEGVKVDADTVVTGPMVVEPKFTTNTYTVTIDDGSKITTHQVKYDSQLADILPEAPTKTGFTFDGWTDGENTVTGETLVKGDMKVEATWTAIKYTIGITVEGERTEKQVAYSTPLADVLPQDPAKVGYTFAGWYVGDAQITPDATVTGNMEIVAKFTPNADTRYTVKHMQEQLDGSFTAVEEQVLTGTTDTQTAAVAKEYEGFTAQSFQQTNIAADSSAVVEIRYTRNTYTVTVGDKTMDVKYGATLEGQMPQDPVKVGYTFAGWFDGDTQITEGTVVEGEINAVAKWTPNPDTKYMVKHMLENLDGTYTEEATEALHGTTDTLTAAVAKEYEGFTAQAFAQKNIAPDGSTVIEIKYDRNVYTVTVDGEDHQVKHGSTLAQVLPENPTKEGHTFQGWFSGEEQVGAETVVEGAMTITSKWELNTYTVEVHGDEYQKFENVPHGTKLGKLLPEDPSKEGQTFAGWFCEGKLVDQNTVVTGNMVITAKFALNTFTVSVDGEVHEDVEYGTKLSEILPEQDPTKVGYTFAGWFVGDVQVTGENLVEGNMNIVSKWEANTNTEYTVKHMQENLDGKGFTTVKTETLTGTTDAQTAASAQDFEGFVAQKFEQKTIAADGSTVVEIKYLRETFTVTVGGKTTENVKYGSTMEGLLPEEPTDEGYAFAGWFDGDTEITEDTVVKGDINATAKFVPATDTEYTVRHMLEQLDGSFDMMDSETLYGTTGTKTKAVAKEYEGYTAQAVKQAVIADDGSTVVEIKYLRNTYTVTINGEVTENVKYGTPLGMLLPEDPVEEGKIFSGWYEGEVGVTEDTLVTHDMVIEPKFNANTYTVTIDGEAHQVEYGTKLSEILPEEPVEAGYTFVGWFVGDEEVDGDTVVEGNMTIESEWEANTDTKYTVKHMQENLDGKGFTAVKTETLTGTTDELTAAAAQKFEGFTVQKFEQKTIAADGSTVVEIKYSRNTFTVTVDGKEYSVKYGETLKGKLPEQAPKAGHTFAGWFDGSTKVTEQTVVKGNMNIAPKWEFNVFTDVKENDWFYEGVRTATFEGLMAGISGTEFGPTIPMNRAMVVQVLYNLAGKPEVALTNEFKDVPANEWYAKAVAWAVKEGVASGYGNGYFGSEDLITREQMAVMLYSYAGKPAVSGKLNFADVNEISDWAKTAMQWAVKNGIMSGVGGNKIAPQAKATRAEAAIMMSQFTKLLDK